MLALAERMDARERPPLRHANKKGSFYAAFFICRNREVGWALPTTQPAGSRYTVGDGIYQNFSVYLDAFHPDP